MKVPDDGQGRVEPRGRRFVEVRRAHVLRPAEAVVVADGEVVAADQLQAEIERVVERGVGPLIAR